MHELERLLIGLTEGALEPADLRRLQGLLADDSESRQFYYRYMSMHASLAWRFGVAQECAEDDAPDTGVLLQIMEDQARLSRECEERDARWLAQLKEEQAQRQRRFGMYQLQRNGPDDVVRAIVIPRALVYLGVAACLLLAVFVGARLLVPGTGAPQMVEQPAVSGPDSAGLPPVAAQVLSSVDARWIGLSPGDSVLRAQTPLTLSAGFAEIELADGARVVVQAPAVFELEGPNAMRLTSGKIVATVPESAAGFVVTTESTQITDLGTEFGLLAGHDGGYQAHVFQGEITLSPTPSSAGGAAGPLVAGEAVSVSSRGQVRTAPADELAFVRPEEYTAIHDAPTSRAARWLAYTYTLRRDAALLAYYSFDEKTLVDGQALNLADATSGGFHATLGDGRVMTRPTPGTDRFGAAAGAMSFNRRQGQALYVDDWPDVGRLDELTISCWFRMSDGHGPWALLVTHWHDQFDRGERFAYHLGLRDARTMPGPPGQTMGLQAHVPNDGLTIEGQGWNIKDEPSRGGETTPRDGWVHVVLTVECGGGAIRLYKNGVEIDFDGASYAPAFLPRINHPLVIGGKATGRGADRMAIAEDEGIGFFHGEIDDVAVLSRALTAEQVRAMYDAGVGDAPHH